MTVTVGDVEVQKNVTLPCDQSGEQDKSNLQQTSTMSETETSGKSGEEVISKLKNSGSKQRIHQKTTQHSKYCIKRILNRSISSKSSKETTKKESPKVLDLTDNLSQVSDDKDGSDSVKFIEELSQDSRYSSSSLKRSRRSYRKGSRSPTYRKDSRSPNLPLEFFLGHSRSPISRHSRSPNKRSFSPIRKHSPLRRRSRSPRFGKSSYRRRSRSPIGRFSRSPDRRHSRSPVKRHSRSPLRRYSRSPLRRRLSPYKKRSRSPYRRHSRSPVRRRSRSPLSNALRLPLRKRSRSPYSRTRRHSRSPYRRSSKSPRRSPIKRYSRSPVHRRSKSPRDLWRESIIESRTIEKSWRNTSPPAVHTRKLNIASGSYQQHVPSKYSSRSRNLETGVGKNLSDLDSISDEDESNYFPTPDKPQHMEEILKLPEPTRTYVLQLLQKYTQINPKEPSFPNFMHFINANKASLPELLESLNPSSGNDSNANYPDPNQNIDSRNSFLQHCLVSNLTTNRAKQGQPPNIPFPVAGPSGIPYPPPRLPGSFVPLPYQQPNVSPFPRPNVTPFPIPNVTPPSPIHAQHGLQRPVLPPLGQYHHQKPHQQKAPTEIIFKDLKATVNKLFGANEGAPNQGLGHSFMPEAPQPEPEKWGLNQGNALQFNPPGGFRNPDVTPRLSLNFPKVSNPGIHFPQDVSSGAENKSRLPVPPPDAKVSFCEAPRAPPANKNLFPVIRNPDVNINSSGMNRSAPSNVIEAKISLAQRLAAVLVKCGMIDVSASLLQEMLMKIGAFSLNPPQDINEAEILDILRKLHYVS